MFPRLYNNPDIPFSLELLLQLPYHTFRTEKVRSCSPYTNIDD